MRELNRYSFFAVSFTYLLKMLI